MLRILCITALVLSLLGGCSLFEEDKIYEWQRPHDTYQVGAFGKAENAEHLKSKLAKNGYESRIETEIVNGVFYLNVLVDVYNPAPDTVDRLTDLTGAAPVLKSKSGSN